MSVPIQDLRGPGRRLPGRGKLLLAPLGWLYGLAAAIDGSIKAAGARSCRKPVLAVGNLEVGGTGKTPLTLALAGILQQLGRRPGLLTGLWGAGQRRGLIQGDDSDFAALAPDEALLMHARLPELPLVAARLKWEGARILDEDPRCDVILLDDGFQHRRLARTLDLVLLSDARLLTPHGLLPAGPLREFPRALRRADLVLLPEGTSAPAAPGPPLQRFRRRQGEIRVLGAATADLAPGGTVIASAIAKPEGFENAALELCAQRGSPAREILRFPDHAPLDRRVSAALASALARYRGASLLCTEKDAHRWAPFWHEHVSADPPRYLELELELSDPAALSAFLAARLS